MAIAPPVDSSLCSIRCEDGGGDSAVPTGAGEIDRAGTWCRGRHFLPWRWSGGRWQAAAPFLEPAAPLGPRDGPGLLEALAHLGGHDGPPSPGAARTPREQLAAQPPEVGVEHAFAALARVGQSRFDGGKPLVDPVELQAAFGQQSELRRVPETQAREPERLESLAHLGKAAVAIALRRDRPSANDERAASPAREAIFVGEIDRPSRQLLSCPPVFLQ